MVEQNCSRFQIKRNKQAYRTEDRDQRARNSFGYHGLIHPKTAVKAPEAHGRRAVLLGSGEPAHGPSPCPRLCVDRHQQESPGHPQQHQARDPQAQG
ncbi:unnamed protein product [Gulo gulo]|uniref:Uncharacterized protein n=1 Tax=Gulo gulo TaxID=48420 RepID=A0A9X9MBX4_GULGU|nr:unnamed protein product [Gulo gulo]